MKKTFIFLFILCGIFTILNGETLPKIVSTSKTAKGFVPKGYKIAKSNIENKDLLIQEDLNKDGQKDLLLVICKPSKEEMEDCKIRTLILAFKEKNSYKLSLIQNGAILDKDMGGAFGDPFESIKVERGSIVIRHYGGSRERWAYTHRFRYQDSGCYLIGETKETMDTMSKQSDKIDKNLLTGNVVKEESDIKGKKTKKAYKEAKKKLRNLKGFKADE